MKTAESLTCQNCKSKFTIEPEDFLFYEKVKVPPPTWCPECRMIRRYAFRNERNLFRVNDVVSGKEIFSGISPQAGFKVYEHDYWWSDQWDPMEYGREYDFSRPFFEQFRELMHDTPWPSRNILNLVNSDYCNNVGDLKNCYLCFDAGYSEDCAYVSGGSYMKNCFDVWSIMRSELCYESVELDESYKTFFSTYCDKVNDVWFSRDCTGCSNCFGCVNLRNKQYMIFNQPYRKEDYFSELDKMKLYTHSGIVAAKEKSYKFWAMHPRKHYHGLQNVNVSGECIYNSKNSKFCYNIEDAEDCKFSQDFSRNVRDSYDYTNWGEECELMYESLMSGNGCRNVKFSMQCWPAVQDTEYALNCHSSNNLFGCVGLNKKSYCILNKQYKPEEYFSLRDKIIAHMKELPYKDMKGRIYGYGEFFPSELSLYAYNETDAQEYFPITKIEAENESPRAYARGIISLKQPAGCLPRVFPTLILDVLSDHILIDT